MRLKYGETSLLELSSPHIIPQMTSSFSVYVSNKQTLCFLERVLSYFWKFWASEAVSLQANGILNPTLQSTELTLIRISCHSCIYNMLQWLSCALEKQATSAHHVCNDGAAASNVSRTQTLWVEFLNLTSPTKKCQTGEVKTNRMNDMDPFTFTTKMLSPGFLFLII